MLEDNRHSHAWLWGEYTEISTGEARWGCWFSTYTTIMGIVNAF